jgi:hypothetical protein
VRTIDWSSAGPRLVGAGILVFCLVFWAATYLLDGKGAVEPLFVTTGGALLGIGQAAQALGELRQLRPASAESRDGGGIDDPVRRRAARACLLA